MDLNVEKVFRNFSRNALARLPEVLAILIGLIAFILVLKVVLGRVENYLIKKSVAKSREPAEYEKRIKTIIDIFNKVLFSIIWLIGVILILSELGVNIGPILTAAGVFGLAVSFGAQSLVKDIINGFFIIFENQIRVGDVAVINGTGGLVETINLRTTILRDLAGIVHVFPNGSINTLSRT